jgi:1-acyl-sn-glycerol-3-phosphate acyltransferase
MGKQLNYCWRLIATGTCFAMFGIGGLLLTVLVFPLQKIIVTDEQKQKRMARQTVHYGFKLFVGLMAFTRVFQFNLEDKLALKHLQGQLVLANHPSLIDVVVLLSIIPNADCVVKAHLFKNPFMRGAITNAGYISNADPEGLLNACKASLAAGNNLIIFPEGTRTSPGAEVAFQRGAANIALRCQVPTTNVLINVTPSTLTKAESWYQIPAEKAIFSMRLVRDFPIISTLASEPVSKQVRHYCRELEQYFKQELRTYE